MRTFLFYSNTIRTDGKFKDLYRAGRLDIAIHSIIHSFFISNGLRKHVEFYLYLNGPPVPPRVIKIVSNIETPWSKKDIATLLKISLIKYNRKGIKNPFPGVEVSNKKLNELIDEFINMGKELYLLDKNGEDIGNVEIKEPLFFIGDFLGIPKEIRKEYEDKFIKISLGDINYFSSQVIMILNWILDKRNIYKDYWDTSHKFEKR